MNALRTVLAVCVLMGLAACGSGSPTTASPSPSAISDAQILALGKQVAECIRNNGVPDFPDPYVEKGKLKLPQEAEADLEQRYSQQVMDQAEQSCQALMERIPEAALKGDQEADSNDAEPGPGDVEALKKLAQCLRDNGLPEWPDPKPDGSFPLRGTPLENEGKSDRIGKAMGACEQHWGGGIRIS